MKARDNLFEMSAATAAAKCPFCSHTGLELNLRCDLGHGPCLYTARCRSCELVFEILVTVDELELGEASELAGFRPRCDDPRRTAAVECSEQTRARRGT